MLYTSSIRHHYSRFLEMRLFKNARLLDTKKETSVLLAFPFAFLFLKIGFAAVIADIFHDFAKMLLIVGVTPLFDEMSDTIAEFATELSVARIGEEAARICEHPDEAGEQSVRGKLLELIHHSSLGVMEPPGSAKLDFAFFAILEAVHKAHRGDIVCFV